MAIDPRRFVDVVNGTNVVLDDPSLEAARAAGAIAGDIAGREAGRAAGLEAGTEVASEAGAAAGANAGSIAGAQAGQGSGATAGASAGATAGAAAGTTAGTAAGTAAANEVVDTKLDKAQNLSDAGNPLALGANIPYVDPDAGDGFVPRSVPEKLRDYKFDGADYGITNDDAAVNWAPAIAEMLRSGRELHLPADGIINSGTAGAVIEIADFYSYLTAYGAGPTIRGVPGRTRIRNNVTGGGWLFDLKTNNVDPGVFKAVMGGVISGLTIFQDPGAVNLANGIRKRSTFQVALDQLQIYRLTGSGVKDLCEVGDNDGNHRASYTDVDIFGCKGWGVDAAAGPGANENSFFTAERLNVQECGVPEQKLITAITAANPPVVTSASHGFVNGEVIYINGANGMAQVNSSVSGMPYTVANATANTYELAGVNGLTWGAFTASPYCYGFPADAESGGIKAKGQIMIIRGGVAAVNHNRNLYISGADGGLPQDLFTYGFNSENPRLIGVHITGLRTWIATGHHAYSNSLAGGAPTYWDILLDASRAVIGEVDIHGLCLRSTADVKEDFLTAVQAMGVNLVRDTIRVHTPVHTKQFNGGAGTQRRYRGINFDRIPQTCVLYATSGTQILLRPDPGVKGGAIMPCRHAFGGDGGGPSLDGEWTRATLPANGLAVSNAGLIASTTYGIYLRFQDNALNIPELVFGTPAFVMDGNYPVKSDDPRQLYIGRVRTDGAGQFGELTDAGWYDPTPIASATFGEKSHLWKSGLDNRLNFRKSAVLPSNSAAFDGQIPLMTQYTKGAVSLSIAANASQVVVFTGLTGLTIGDPVTEIRFAPGLGGAVWSGEAISTTEIQVRFYNPPDNAAIAKGPATMYALVNKWAV